MATAVAACVLGGERDMAVEGKDILLAAGDEEHKVTGPVDNLADPGQEDTSAGGWVEVSAR
jgi:hypothetical protein